MQKKRTGRMLCSLALSAVTLWGVSVTAPAKDARDALRSLKDETLGVMLLRYERGDGGEDFLSLRTSLALHATPLLREGEENIAQAWSAELEQKPDAGAVPVAAVLFHKLPVEGKKVACVVSGGNIDVNILNRVITRGLVMSGRKANMTIALEDKPGQLKKVAEIVSRCGSNVVSVQHDGSDPNMPISSCFLKLTLETRDAAQIEQIRAELAKEGFQLVSERV